MGDMAVYKLTTEESCGVDDDSMELELIPAAGKVSVSARKRRRVCFAAMVIFIILLLIGFLVLVILYRQLKVQSDQAKVVRVGSDARLKCKSY